MEVFDVAIIGGGPSGSSAATYLSRNGFRVVLFEKEQFPREHIGESLIPFCNYRLRDLGVIDEVEKFATKKPGINFIDKTGLRQSVWCFERILPQEIGLTFHTQRALFDKTLLDHAARKGATVLQRHSVKDVDLSDPSKVVLRVQDAEGQEKQYTARFLLDGSGQYSFLAKKLGGKNPYKGLDRVAFYRRWHNNNYDEALNAGMIKIVYLGGQKKGWLWVIPIGRNYLSIGVSLNHEYVRERKKELSSEDWKNELYAGELAEATCLNDILKNSTPEEDTRVVSDYSYSVEKKYGENYAMIGDAGAFLDPIFSSGLFVAMETAYRVTHAVQIKLKQDATAARIAFEEAFADIDAGYKLIEQFVRIFYDDELLNFSHLGPGDDGYDQFIRGYNIFHYLMAGDFFSQHKKYSEFMSTLTQERNYNKFIHYTQTKAQEYPNDEYCRYTFEQVYGHLPKEH